MSLLWDVDPHKRCRRCRHTAREHEHYTPCSACAVCDCPAFAGRVARLMHLITRRWP